MTWNLSGVSPTRDWSSKRVKRRRLATLWRVEIFRLAIRAKLGNPEGREFRHESGTFSARLCFRVVAPAVGCVFHGSNLVS